MKQFNAKKEKKRKRKTIFKEIRKNNDNVILT